MHKQTKFQLFALIAMMLAALAAFGQAKQSEEDKILAMMDEQIALMRNPANLKTEAFEAESDEHKVLVYRLFLRVPERKAAKGVTARKAEWIAIHYRLQVTYHVATSQRYEAWTEAMMLGADAMDAMKIDREHYEAEGNILGKTTMTKLRYFAGAKLVASQDLMAINTAQANKIIDRMLKLEEWARMKSGN
jgi:hypothetical protein